MGMQKKYAVFTFDMFWCLYAIIGEFTPLYLKVNGYDTLTL
jgi:hypothetical protein